MKPQTKKLYEQWTTLDNRVLGKSPISVRLPIHLQARLSALAQVFPNRSRSDFIIDLLNAALAGFEEESLPVNDFPEMRGHGPSFNQVMGQLYREKANAEYRKLAKEVGMKNVAELFSNGEANNA